MGWGGGDFLAHINLRASTHFYCREPLDLALAYFLCLLHAVYWFPLTLSVNIVLVFIVTVHSCTLLFLIALRAVVALAGGGANLKIANVPSTTDGCTIHDYHPEVLARRSFFRYLYSQLNLCISLSRATLAGESSSDISHGTSYSEPYFLGYKLHFF